MSVLAVIPARYGSTRFPGKPLAEIAGQMMTVRQEELGIDYFDRRNTLIDAVTLEDVNRVAAEFLQPENFSVIVVGQPQGVDTE